MSENNKATSTNTLAGKGLPAELITKLMSEGKTRAYGPRLLDFVNSEEAAINPREVWPLEFANKTASALMQSFKNAAKSADILDQLTLIRREDDVFIIHNERAAVAE